MFVLLLVLTFDEELELVAVVVISVWVCENAKLESINKNGTTSIFIDHTILTFRFAALTDVILTLFCAGASKL